jgi:hypothetical protein
LDYRPPSEFEELFAAGVIHGWVSQEEGLTSEARATPDVEESGFRNWFLGRE